MMPPDDPLVAVPAATPFRAEVIDLDGVRIQFGLPATRLSTCGHKSLMYSQQERRVWCNDCKRTVENFDAFMTFVLSFEKMERAARLKMQRADDAMTATIHRRATKHIDKAWSGRLAAIACVHCGGGLLPEDYADGVRARSSRELELRRRKKDKGA